MPVPDAVRRRFRHHAWAGSRLADALDVTPDAAALRAFAHALAADHVWHQRVKGWPPETDVWPDLDANGCRALLARTTADWLDLLDPEEGTDPDASVSYATSRGEAFTSRVSDVLDHVLLHAAHHRGQANAALRAAGSAPPALDLIHWVRLGEPAP